VFYVHRFNRIPLLQYFFFPRCSEQLRNTGSSGTQGPGHRAIDVTSNGSVVQGPICWRDSKLACARFTILLHQHVDEEGSLLTWPMMTMSPQQCTALGLPPGSMVGAPNESGAQNEDASATAAEQKAKRALERRSNFLAAMQANKGGGQSNEAIGWTPLAACPGSPLRAHDFGFHCVPHKKRELRS
jgi:hypothetical protein